MKTTALYVAVVCAALFSFPAAVFSGAEETRYELPKDMPEAHQEAMTKAGWNKEKIEYFKREIYARYRRAYAFSLMPNALPTEHLLLLGEYANAVTGNYADPYLIAAIHKNEVFAGVDVGNCSFYPRAVSGKRLVTGIKKRQTKRQKEAFEIIISDINHSPRFKGVEPHHPSVSCKGGELGYFQIRPTVWIHYRDEVLGILGLSVASPYEMLPSVIAANVILRDMMAYLKLTAAEVTLENSLYFAQAAAAYNTGATNAQDYVNGYGMSAYKTARKMRREKEKSALATVCIHVEFLYPSGGVVCKDR